MHAELSSGLTQLSIAPYSHSHNNGKMLIKETSFIFFPPCLLTCPASFHAQETVEKSGYRAYESFSMSDGRAWLRQPFKLRWPTDFLGIKYCSTYKKVSLLQKWWGYVSESIKKSRRDTVSHLLDLALTQHWLSVDMVLTQHWLSIDSSLTHHWLSTDLSLTQH